MKTLITVIGMAVTAMIANAQIVHKATIPFNFAAGGTEFVAGTYEIRQMGHFPIVQITNLETKRSKAVPAPISLGVEKTSSPKLVFQVAGDEHSLSEIWLGGAPGMKTYQSGKGRGDAASVKVAIQ